MKYLYRNLNTYLFFLFSLLVYPLFSQAYDPVLKLGRSWGVEFTNFTQSQPLTTFGYVILTDTTYIDSTLYYTPEDMTIFEPYLFREDTILKQVYVYDIDAQEEYVIMDFSLEIGDTVPANFRHLNRMYLYQKDTLAIVDNIDSVELTDGTFRKRLHIIPNTNQGLYYYMIEGIGGALGFVSSGAHYFEHSRNLLCVKDDGEFIYGHCDPLSVEEHGKQESIEVYSNPIYNEFTVLTDIPYSIQIYNVLGALVYQSNLSSTSHFIDFRSYQSGVYLLKGLNADNNQIFVKRIIKE